MSVGVLRDALDGIPFRNYPKWLCFDQVDISPEKTECYFFCFCSNQILIGENKSFPHKRKK